MMDTTQMLLDRLRKQIRQGKPNVDLIAVLLKLDPIAAGTVLAGQ